MAVWGIAFAFGLFTGIFLNWIFFKVDEKWLQRKRVLGVEGRG